MKMEKNNMGKCRKCFSGLCLLAVVCMAIAAVFLIGYGCGAAWQSEHRVEITDERTGEVFWIQVAGGSRQMEHCYAEGQRMTIWGRTDAARGYFDGRLEWKASQEDAAEASEGDILVRCPVSSQKVRLDGRVRAVQLGDYYLKCTYTENGAELFLVYCPQKHGGKHLFL